LCKHNWGGARVANGLSDTVAPIATATNTAGPPIPVGTDPSAIAITPAAVSQGPAFTSGSAATAAFRRAFTFTVTASGDPAPRITRTGRLPSGVRFADYGDGTATISGIPAEAAAGVYPLTLTARNKNGTAHPGVHPDRHPGPGDQEDPDYQGQGGRCAAADRPGHGIPGSFAGGRRR